MSDEAETALPPHTAQTLQMSHTPQSQGDATSSALESPKSENLQKHRFRYSLQELKNLRYCELSSQDVGDLGTIPPEIIKRETTSRSKKNDHSKSSKPPSAKGSKNTPEWADEDIDYEEAFDFSKTVLDRDKERVREKSRFDFSERELPPAVPIPAPPGDVGRRAPEHSGYFTPPSAYYPAWQPSDQPSAKSFTAESFFSLADKNTAGRPGYVSAYMNYESEDDEEAPVENTVLNSLFSGLSTGDAKGLPPIPRSGISADVIERKMNQ